MRVLKLLFMLAVLGLFLYPLSSEAEDFYLTVMQDKTGDIKKYSPLFLYLKEHGVTVLSVEAKNYYQAAKMFSEGNVKGMFSGSGIAGCMIIKDVAYPLVRPVSKEGWSTYSAVVLAPKGSPPFLQNADYFENKTVAFCRLASSGEFFFRSLEGISKVKVEIKNVVSHSSAIWVLATGASDVAIVKSRVWDSVRSNFKSIIQVGRDLGENPNGTLIVSKNIKPEVVKKISDTLLGIKNDDSELPRTVNAELNISGYVKTTLDDFKDTLNLLKRAAVDKSYNFE